MGIPQTSVQADFTSLVAGQLADDRNVQIDSYPASETILPGTVVEVVSGQVRNAKATSGSPAPFGGVAMYKDATTPGGYLAGQMVPVVKKGRVAALWSGTTQGELTAPNYWHSSTGANPQGYFTDAATATTAGAEVSAAPSGVVLVRNPGVSGLCLVDLNLP